MSVNHAWLMVVVAGLIEITWPFLLRASDNFSRLGWSAATVLALVTSFWFLNRALSVLPVGTAYAAWTGIGTIGAVIAGIVFLKEPATFARLLFVGLIVAGLLGLKLTTQAPGH
ncbi:MAG: cation/cationic drug transporter [Puniceicoccaceae bacterium 5H]|nr:MAG: cation/cationic drug transporter [Puniceicoccaceae bacterium 5H]